MHGTNGILLNIAMKFQVPICQSPRFAVYSRSLFPLECCANLENKLPNIGLGSQLWFTLLISLS